MATTIKVADTLNWIYAFVSGRPTQGVGGTAGEPGLTSANLIMGVILNAPFAWEWNRAETTFTTNAGQSDYQESLASFGYLEKATCSTNQVSPNPTVRELEISRVIAAETTENPPQRIAILLDDNAGNITFRIFPTPDDTYTVTLTYQKQATVIAAGTNLSTQSWAPIPDKLAFIYETGLLAQIQGIYNVQLYFNGMEMFYRHLVGASEGLTETEKALFLGDKIRELREQQAAQLGTQIGKRARS